MILSQWLDWMAVLGYISVTIFVMYQIFKPNE